MNQTKLEGYITWRMKLCILIVTGLGSLVGSETAWDASRPEIDPLVWHILLCRFGHENIFMTILPPTLI